MDGMNDWITDRRPTEDDCAAPHFCVYDAMGHIVHYRLVADGEPWKPVLKCEPYVKSKRFRVEESRPGSNRYAVYDNEDDLCCSFYLPTREAAERIAAIYEEMMP